MGKTKECKECDRLRRKLNEALDKGDGPQIYSQLSDAERKGVHYYFADNVIGGCFDISSNTAAEIILGADMDVMRASILGVTVSKLKEWAEVSHDGRCRKILKNGKRCGNINDMLDIRHPNNYKKGINDMCRLHKENKK